MEIDPTLLIMAVLVALFIGYMVRQALIDSMSNVRKANTAQDYLQRDSVTITTSIDTYLFTNISVIPKSERHDDDDDTPVDDVDDNNDLDDNDASDSGDSSGDSGSD